MKTCRICCETKAIDDFGFRPKSRDGHKYWCKRCGLKLFARWEAEFNYLVGRYGWVYVSDLLDN